MESERKPYKFVPEKREAFLDALRNGARRGAAATSVGIHRQTICDTMRAEPDFAAAVNQAELDANELIEDALFKTAQGGNTTAQQVWLYNRMPDRWQDRRAINQNPLEAFFVSLPPELASPLRQILAGQPITGKAPEVHSAEPGEPVGE